MTAMAYMAWTWEDWQPRNPHAFAGPKGECCRREDGSHVSPGVPRPPDRAESGSASDDPEAVRAYYNRDRPHGSLGLGTPEVRDRRKSGVLRCHSVLGGLHHSYEWAA